MKSFYISTAVIFMAHAIITCAASFNQVADVFAVIAANELKSSGNDPIGEELLNRVKNTLFPEKSAYNQNRALDESRQSTSKATGPLVQTNEGLVIGETTENSHAFYGVPYGAPPNGTKRFMPPEPVESYKELNLSTPDRRNCWQALSCEPNCVDELHGYLTEDCLVLQIFVPSSVDLSDPNNPPDERLPVMFWIHGGFFFRGAGTSFTLDAHKLSESTNTIVVKVNYRVGPLGFLSFQDGDTFIDGNQGLKDQQLALKWVHNNIEKFGGDKNKVTLFGNSAGAQSIIFHLLSSKSEPYFQRGVIQSSPTVFSYQTSLASSKTITRRYLDALECDNDVSCLRELDPQVLVDAISKMLPASLADGDMFGAIEPFRPVIDGEEFRAQPLTLFKNGQWQSHKELIIGTTNEEMAWIEAVFTSIGFPLPKRLFEIVNEFVLGKENGKIVSDYYSGGPLDRDYADNFAGEITDFFFACPNRAMARFAAETSTNPKKNVYLFNFAYPISEELCNATESFTEVCGTSFHSSERIVLFKSDYAFGTTFTPDDELVSEMMTAYWGKFAYTGDLVEDWNNSQFPAWPIYKSAQDGKWQNIKLDVPNSSVENDYKKEACDLWDEIGFYFESNETTTASTTTDFISATVSTTTRKVEETESTTDSASSIALHTALILQCAILAILAQLGSI